jgi:hypothetical protein
MEVMVTFTRRPFYRRRMSPYTSRRAPVQVWTLWGRERSLDCGEMEIGAHFLGLQAVALSLHRTLYPAPTFSNWAIVLKWATLWPAEQWWAITSLSIRSVLHGGSLDTAIAQCAAAGWIDRKIKYLTCFLKYSVWIQIGECCGCAQPLQDTILTCCISPHSSFRIIFDFTLISGWYSDSPTKCRK